MLLVLESFSISTGYDKNLIKLKYDPWIIMGFLWVRHMQRINLIRGMAQDIYP